MVENDMDRSGRELKIGVISGTVDTWKGDAIVIGVYEGGKAQPALAHCGEPLAAEVGRVLKEGWMKGKPGENLLLPIPEGSNVPIRRLLLLGLGKVDGIDAERMRAVGGHLVKACDRFGIATVVSILALDRHNGLKRRQVEEGLAEGAGLARYRFDRFKSVPPEEKKSKPHPFKELRLVVDTGRVTTVRKRLARVQCINKGVCLARDLANQPGNLLNPQGLAEQAKKLADEFPVKATIWDEKKLAGKKMNGILAVGQGSVHPPRLIVMEYKKGGKMPLLAVVGKAVTFDSGGISLKPGAKMEDMKFDMSGGAAVFGFMRAIAEMKLPVNVVGIVPSAENMPSGSAQRPGDVIETAKGVFVEVINTDAEGRLLLAEALHHADGLEPGAIIDLATLTGACVIALGSKASGLMGNNKTLSKQLQRAGKRSGDRVWPLPMFPEYQEQIKSTVADVKNVGNREAGTITAACFLSRFVDKDRPWAHIDIAGTAWDQSGAKPHVPKGATGVGVRLLCRFLEQEWMK